MATPVERVSYASHNATSTAALAPTKPPTPKAEPRNTSRGTYTSTTREGSGDTLLSARISSLKSQREPSKAFTSRMLFLRLQHRSRLPERRTNVGRINPSHQRGIIGQPIAPCKLQLIRNSSFQLPAGIAADMLPGFDHNDELTISLKARRES